jgi:hypothetical protein
MKFNETLDHLLRALRMNEEDTDLNPAGAGSAGVMRSPGSVPRSPLPANPLPPWVVRDLPHGADPAEEPSDRTSDEAAHADAEGSDGSDDTTGIVRRVLAASPPPLPEHLEPARLEGDGRQSADDARSDEQSSVETSTDADSLEHRDVPAPDLHSALLTVDADAVEQSVTVSRWTYGAEGSSRSADVESSATGTAEPEVVEDHERTAQNGALDVAELPVLEPSELDGTDATVDAADAEPSVSREPVSSPWQGDLAAPADDPETALSEPAPDAPSSSPEPEPDSELEASAEESSELSVSTLEPEAASPDGEHVAADTATLIPRQPDFASLEKAAILAESLNLGFHLGSAVERIAIAAAEGSAGIAALREASWLIDRYVALLERRPIGADLHRSAVLLTQTGDTIAGMRALVDALDLEVGRTRQSEPQAVSTAPTNAA